MKSILLYVHDDNGMESRMQAALDLARAVGGHVECITVRPLAALMLSDPFGASFIVPAVLESLDNEAEAAQRRMAARMAKEDVAWSLIEGDGDAANLIAERARLADIVTLTVGGVESKGESSDVLIGDVVMNCRTPVLVVPVQNDPVRFDGTVIVAWNGTEEAANAMRAATPLLMNANTVHLVCIGDEDLDYPTTDAAAYLSRHGIKVEIHLREREGKSVLDALNDAVNSIGADWMVMGAYGSGRLREALFGGVTRGFLENSPIPLFITH